MNDIIFTYYNNYLHNTTFVSASVFEGRIKRMMLLYKDDRITEIEALFLLNNINPNRM